MTPTALTVGVHNTLTIAVTNTGAGPCQRIIVMLSFPTDLIVTDGSTSIEIGQLASGDTAESRIDVRPRRAGTWTVRTPNFSFRDCWDEPQRVTGLTHEISATAAPTAAVPPAVPRSAAPDEEAGRDGVFISYRRAGTPMHADLLDKYLVTALGRQRVFRDVQSIGYGLPFRPVIVDAIHAAQVVLVLIGPTWLTVADQFGRRRLDQVDDLVRIEIETALATNGVRTVPVLCDGTTMPAAAALPRSLRRLVELNSFPLVAADHAKQLARLVREWIDGRS